MFTRVDLLFGLLVGLPGVGGRQPLNREQGDRPGKKGSGAKGRL